MDVELWVPSESPQHLLLADLVPSTTHLMVELSGVFTGESLFSLMTPAFSSDCRAGFIPSHMGFLMRTIITLWSDFDWFCSFNQTYICGSF